MMPRDTSGQPAGQVETATGEEVRRQVMGEDVEETGEQRAAHHPGTNTIEGMDEAVTDHPDGGGAEGTDQDTGGHRDRRHDADDRFAGQHDVGNEETDVNQGGKEHDQQRTIATELTPALHHLRNAHARALGRREGNHQPADHVPQGNRQQAPEQIEMEHLNHHGAGDDRQWCNVGAEP